MITWLWLACGGDEETGGGQETESCGDLDGDGTDSGDIPDVLGSWSAYEYGVAAYIPGCAITGADQESEDEWIDTLNVEGRVPDGLYAWFGVEEARDQEYFYGALDPRGGITFTGTHADAAGTVYANFSGLVFMDTALNKNVIRGSATVAYDVDDDAVIDCYNVASWSVNKAGL
jgi:hypothetical protein